MQPTQDTAGFFARDAAGGAAFARALYGDKFGNYTAFPKVRSESMGRGRVADVSRR
jgi:hypothetical protein